MLTSGFATGEFGPAEVPARPESSESSKLIDGPPRETSNEPVKATGSAAPSDEVGR